MAGDSTRGANFAENLEELELLGPIGRWVGQHVQGFRERLGLALAQAERDRLSAVIGQGLGQLGRQPGERPAGIGRLEPCHQPLDVVGPGAIASNRAQRVRSGSVPAAANRRISRSAMVACTIGRFQARGLENIASTSSGSLATLASSAHQSRSGMWMSCCILSCVPAGHGRSAGHPGPAAASPSRRAGCGPRHQARSRRARARAAATGGDT